MAVPKRARQRLELVAIAAVALAAAFVQHPPGDNQTAHLALVKAIADGTPRIDRYQDETADDSYIDGHFYTAKAPGLALFTEPWYLVLRATNLDVANPAAGAGSLGFLANTPLRARRATRVRTPHEVVPAGRSRRNRSRHDGSLAPRPPAEARDLMRVGLSLLTLVPGISGGSETYARELARALARVGTHEYVALVPPLAPDAGDGLRTIVADGYPSSTTTAGRLRAMGDATLRPARLRALLGDVDVVHYPLTVPVPRPAGAHVITLLDVQHLDLPGLFPRGERLFRKLAYDRASRKAAEVIVISEFVRERVVERLGLDPAHVHTVWLGVDHERYTPASDVEREPLSCTPRTAGRTRTTTACSRHSRCSAGATRAPPRPHGAGHGRARSRRGRGRSAPCRSS